MGWLRPGFRPRPRCGSECIVIAQSYKQDLSQRSCVKSYPTSGLGADVASRVGGGLAELTTIESSL